MNLAEQGMGFGLRWVGRLAGSDVLDRLGIRERTEKLVFEASRSGFRTATTAGRTFSAAQKLGRPARQSTGSSSGLFDLTPDDDQEMFREAVSDFAAARVRPAALDADAACAVPDELLAQATELGVAQLGVPEELGGVMAERSAVAAALIAEALAHGDMGIAFAILAPGAVATAIGLWGDEEQEAAYLPAFTGEDPPPAALAVQEPHPLFDPHALRTRARRDGADWVLSGVKAFVPRASSAELFVVAADAEGLGPALFIVEPALTGMFTEPEPAMGLRAASTQRLLLTDVRVPGSALLGDGRPEVFAECVQRARVAWAALATGTAQAVLDYLIPYVNERKAFGEPISNRQAVAFNVADIAIEVEGLRLATWRAASRADQGMTFDREAALARRLAADKGVRIGSDGVQLLGGHGYIKEHPVERWYRDLRSAGVMEGALLA